MFRFLIYSSINTAMNLRSSQASSRLNLQEIPHPLQYPEKDYLFKKIYCSEPFEFNHNYAMLAEFAFHYIIFLFTPVPNCKFRDQMFISFSTLPCTLHVLPSCRC